jgi:hypothetical protein
MSITVGLDFGTHQTKICIGDATITNQKTYEFFEFFDNGKKSFFLPSVVQINSNGTLSYGTVDENNCKIVKDGFIINSIPDLKIPIFKEIPEPIFNDFPEIPLKTNYPSKPQKQPYPKKPTTFSDAKDWKSTLQALKNKMLNKDDDRINEWKNEIKKIDHKFSKTLYEWELKCDAIDDQYDKALKNREIECNSIEKQNEGIRENYLEEKRINQEEFEIALSQYNFKRNQFHYLAIEEDGKVSEEKYIFHYFKFALYSNDVKWYHQIDQETISIWYLANIIFLLQEKFGDLFFLQIGIPCGINKRFNEKQKEKAIGILISAFKLIEHFENHSEYLLSTYEELLSLTEKTSHYSFEDLNNYGIDALPEAYAGLVSLTQKKKLEKGMNLLVDIGGGTTDIAFFTITDDDLPDIHAVHSLYKGLNFIYENAASKSSDPDIVRIQQLVDNNHEKFEQLKYATNLYHSELQKEVRKIIGAIKDSFINRYNIHGLHISTLNNALLNRPVIFSGGGSTFNNLIQKVDSFSDLMKINQEMLSITTLKSEIIDDNMFSILATAYGLSIPIENETSFIEIKNIFDHIVGGGNNDSSSNGYVHGISDY